MKIAYVCYKDGQFGNTVKSEDEILFNYLIEKGLNIATVTWTDPDIDWKDFELVILKSPWDYFEQIDNFYAWLNKLVGLGVRLLNPPATIKWNSDKHYLNEIDEAGLPVIPSIFLEKNEFPDIAVYFERLKTNKIIIKPCVSAGSVNTFKVAQEEASEWNSKLKELLKNEAFIVQPFVDEIQTDGEYSFLFFNGKFSHHVLKKAKEGDFRVQSSYGGSIHTPEMSSDLIDQAQQYSDKFAKDCLYARVDGIIRNGKFSLMELELIEPFLFLAQNENSYQNYYSAIKDLLILHTEEK